MLLTLMNFSQARCENTLAIPAVNTSANTQVTVNIEINNSQTFVGFQLDVPVPAGMSYLTNSATLNPSRSNGHLLSAALISGNTLRIIAFSFSNNAFNGTSGTVASFQIQTSAIPGSYPLQIQNAVISGANASNILTGTINGSLTIFAPNLLVNPLSENFGAVPLGQTSDRYFEILNNGNQNLNITSIAFSNGAFSNQSNDNFTISPGNSYSLQIRFTAITKGDYNAIMTINSNDPDASNTQIALTANAFAVNELHCGNLEGASGSTVELSISINNMESFTGFQFDLQLPEPLTYIQGSCTLDPARINNHLISVNSISEQTIRVVAFSAVNASFIGNSGVIASLEFQINGTGGVYPLNIDQVIIGDAAGTNILSASYSGWLTITSPDIHCDQTVSFGNIAINNTGNQSLTIYNYGQESLTIGSASFTNPVFSYENSFPIHIAPWSNVNLNLVFDPSVGGNATGVLKLFSNDPDESPLNVQLSAFAFNPNYFSVTNLTTTNNSSASLSITAENFNPFVGFQMDILLPEGINYVTGSAALNASRKQDHVLFVSELSERSIRLLAFSPGQLTFNGNSGNIISIDIATDDNITPGFYPVTLENAIMGDQTSQNILWATNSGTIEVSALSSIGMKVFLEGAYLTGQMTSNLKNNGLLPLNQPFNMNPWNHAGNESAIIFPNNTVDWVLVELRDAASPETATETTIMSGWPKAMLLLQDGSIVDVNGNPAGLLSSSVQHQVYLVIHHRNHLSVMSSGPLVLSGNSYSYDFTDAITKAYGGAAGYKQLADGVFGMVAGDIDADGAVGVSDFNLWAQRFGLADVYNAADADLDGQVSTSDFNKWAVNFGVQWLINAIQSNKGYKCQLPDFK